MMFDITVNPTDGSVRIGQTDQILVARLPLEKAAEMLAPLSPEEIDHRNGYRWLTARNGFTFANFASGLSHCFHNERLISVHFGVSFGDEKTWADAEIIEREVSFMRSEFSKIFLRSFRTGEEHFYWGAAWAVFDQRGYMSSSGVSYKTLA